MKYLFQLAAACAALLFIGGCEVIAPLIGPDISRVETYQERVSYHRGACYGRCPVYTLRLYDNGLIVYEGERFSDKEGTWQRTIDRRQADALIDSFTRAGFQDYPRTFRKQVVDASSIDMVYTTPEGTAYATSYADYMPPELSALDRSMRRLADLGGYRPVSDTIQGLFTSKTAIVKERQQAIVQLRAGVVPENWIVKYSRQNLELKGRIAPNGDYYTVSIDPNALSAEETIDLLRSDEDVLSAQLDRQVKPR